MRVDVHFETGRDILHAYWGYLSGGGITLEKCGLALRPDQRVTLLVHVGAHRQFEVSGRVARTSRDATLVAFDTIESQNQLLAAALSHCSTDFIARLTPCNAARREPVTARVHELSEDGCCLRLGSENAGAFPVGSEVTIEAPGFSINGCIISTQGRERCVIFGIADSQALQGVRAVLHSAARAA